MKLDVVIYGEGTVDDRKVIIKKFKLWWTPEEDSWTGSLEKDRCRMIERFCRDAGMEYHIFKHNIVKSHRVRNLIGTEFSMVREDAIRRVEIRK